MKLELVGEEESIEMVNEYVNSREWWIFPGTQEAALIIEEKFYSGDANVDFHVLIGMVDLEGLKVWGCSFARKTRMSAKQLGDLVGMEIPEEKDVVFGTVIGD